MKYIKNFISFEEDNFEDVNYSNDVKKWMKILTDLRYKYGFGENTCTITIGKGELYEKYLNLKKELEEKLKDFDINCYGNCDNTIYFYNKSFMVKLDYYRNNLKYWYGTSTYHWKNYINNEINWDLIGDDYNYIVNKEYDYNNMEIFDIMDQTVFQVKKGKYDFRLNISIDGSYIINGLKPKTEEEAKKLLNKMKELSVGDNFLLRLLNNITIEELMKGKPEF